ncbi:monocarboxylate transporter 4-like [Porites lutea]|uniref:monocarboxylate transporter 4-like n=1 Tax=Porites lutea TaxID=51062 RepID=UPI003CC60382
MDYFYETRERTAWVGSLGLAFIFSLGPLTGSLVDRFGCRITAFVGGISCVSGLLLSSLATRIAILYVTYSILFGFGSSCMFVSCYVVTSLYFNKRQSIATGIIASGSGIGVLAVAPILQVLLDNFHWRKTYRITAGIFSVVCFLCLTFDPTVVKTGREEREGEEENIESENLQEKNDVKKKRWFVDCSVFKNKRFVVLTLSAILYNLGHNTPRLHLVRFSEGLNVSADAASRLFIYIGVTTFIGRLLSGLLCNMRRVNPVYVYMGGLILDGCDIIFLTQAKTYGHLVAFSFLFGLADGVLVGAFYIQILMSVGPSLKASAMGLSSLCYGTTIATGPALAGFMTDRLHSYIPSLIFSAVTIFAAAALLLILVCDRKSTQPETLHCIDSEEHFNRAERETGL